jgi:hypothetical protein
MAKGFQKKYYHSNTQSAQGGGRPVNQGVKKVGDNPREPLKCWECGEPHLRRNCPHLISMARTSVHKLQEALTVGDMGRSVHKINEVVDGRQGDHQSTIVDIEGKIHDNHISILIDLGAILSYVTPGLVELNKLKKVKHAKFWLVQLATGTKRKVTYFIPECELSIDGQSTKLYLNILPLGSYYDLIIRMGWLEKHKVILKCYKKVTYL